MVRKQQSGIYNSYQKLAFMDSPNSGSLYFGKFTDGTEPNHEPGKTYYNTSIGKMKIGGATNWESITSI